jgi:tetratricopeptide (TPR) repeat protein
LGKAIEAGAAGGADTTVAVALFPLKTYLAGVWRDGAASSLHQRLSSKLWPDANPTRQWGLIQLSESLPNWTCRDAVARAALAGSRKDPYLQVLWDAGKWADPAFPLMDLTGLDPDLQRVEPQIDIPAVPLPGTTLGSKQLGARWEGDLRITEPGEYRFAIEGERSARLLIGDFALLRTLPGRREMSLTLAAGWIPLHLEWWQGMSGKGRVVLQWKTPGSAGFTAIPVEQLAHGADHQPGLLASYWKQVRPQTLDRPRPVEVQRAAAMPWQPEVQAALADAYLSSDQPQEAIDVLERAHALGLASSRLDKLRLRALAREGKAQYAADVLDLFARNRCCQNQSRLAANIATTLARGHLQDDILKRFESDYEPCCVGPWIFARMALGRGDWRQTLRYLDALKLEERDFLYWHVRIEQILLRRVLDGTEPDWDELHDWAIDKRLSPSQRLFLAWYSGQKTWDAVVSRLPETPDGDEVYWYRGLQDLTSGDFPAAVDAWKKTDRHPNWIESADSDMLLAWYGRQTPKSLAKLPKAKPLPGRGAEAGPSNF